jgi:hypothetical protein
MILGYPIDKTVRLVYNDTDGTGKYKRLRLLSASNGLG